GARCDRLLKARVVVGLCQVDPADLRAGIRLPRLEEAAEEEIVQVLIVEAHEGKLDAGELAFLDALLGRTEAQLADLLPVSIGGSARSDARNLQDLSAEVVGGKCLRDRAQNARAAQCGDRRSAGSTLENAAATRLHRHQLIVDVFLHKEVLPSTFRL